MGGENYLVKKEEKILGKRKKILEKERRHEKGENGFAPSSRRGSTQKEGFEGEKGRGPCQSLAQLKGRGKLEV